jgi:hypothetical protein
MTESNDTENDGVFRALIKHPVILAVCLFANLGGAMRILDNVDLGSCLSMVSI